MPFIISLYIAYCVQKPAELLSSRLRFLNKKCCAVLLAVGIMAVASIVIVGIFSSFCGCAVNICTCMPRCVNNVLSFIGSHTDKQHDSRLAGYFISAVKWISSFFSENYSRYLPTLMSYSTSMLSCVPSFLTAAFFSVISALFACADFDEITEFLMTCIPSGYRSAILLVISSANRTIACIFKTYGKLMLITFCELALGLSIISLICGGSSNIISTALIIAIVDILPILGTGTVLVPWGIFELLTGHTLYGILLLILFAVIGFIRNILEPKLMGKNLELSPFITLIAIYIGGVLFGIRGIILLPLTVIIIRDTLQKKDDAV